MTNKPVLSETGTNMIEETYYLQHYKEGWTDGKWEEKMDERECIEDHGFEKVTHFLYFNLVFVCIPLFIVTVLIHYLYML